MALTVGSKLSEYEILAPIGAGAMGEVYRARDTHLGREVAIKILPEEFARDADRLARFEREARLLASLNHPGIATLHELGDSDDVRYLVMELIEGETLQERIARGPIPAEEALPLFLQMAEALEAAHDKRVVHRDLKPPNIKITPEGQVKILDFGLAKAYREESTSVAESPTRVREVVGEASTETVVGTILGTAPYMSPEQARGKSVDKRADIWAFGCVFYEALTAKRAFDGDAVADILGAIVKTEPNWELLPETTPLRIRELLRRCLEKDARYRLRDVGEAWVAIEEALKAPTQTEDVAGARPDGRFSRFVLAPALTALVAGLLVWALTRPDVSLPVTRSVISVSPADELRLMGGSLAISADGRNIAYVGQVSGEGRKLYLRRLDELESNVLDDTESASAPFFSPDGQWVGYWKPTGATGGGALMKVSITGGAPVTIANWEEGGGFRGASWSPDGWIVLGRYNGLARVRDDGSGAEELTLPSRERREKVHILPQILPGGEAVLFTLGTGDIDLFDDASIAVLSLVTGEYRVVMEGGTKARYVDTGHIVYARGGSLFAVLFDVDRLELTGVAMPIVDDVSMRPTGGWANFVISKEGTLVYAAGGVPERNASLWWVDRAGEKELLLDDGRWFMFPTLSPDGRRLAVATHGMNSSVWVYDFARGTLSRLASGFDNNIPIWTPDSRRVMFWSTRDGPGNMYWQPADGSAPAERLIASDLKQMGSSWTPDGNILAFQETDLDSGDNIFLLSIPERTTEVFLHTEFNEYDPFFSPNGRWIVYESDESGRREIYVRPFPKAPGRWQVSTDGGDYGRWNPNGREIFYRSGNKMMAVDVTTEGELTLGVPRLLFESDLSRYYAVAPDGQRFVMTARTTRQVAPKELVLVQNWSEELKRIVPLN